MRHFCTTMTGILPIPEPVEGLRLEIIFSNGGRSNYKVIQREITSGREDRETMTNCIKSRIRCKVLGKQHSFIFRRG